MNQIRGKNINLIMLKVLINFIDKLDLAPTQLRILGQCLCSFIVPTHNLLFHIVRYELHTLPKGTTVAQYQRDVFALKLFSLCITTQINIITVILTYEQLFYRLYRNYSEKDGSQTSYVTNE